LEDLGADRKIILKRIFKKKYEGTWTALAEYSDRWRVVANAVMNLGLHKMLEIS